MTLLLLLLGCPTTISQKDTSDYFPGDADNDGWTVDEGDCDDENRDVNPGQAEIWYDGADANCDGADDYDADADGFAQDRDCNDADATVYPRADELCDGLDNDCDEDVDELPVDGITAYRDADNDGYAADGAAEVEVCELVAGYTDVKGDCDDSEHDIAPDAPELCNGEDDDCDGSIDDTPADAELWYPDDDGDGFGAAGLWVAACDAPVGFVDDDSDCDDTSNAAFPGAVEVCDELDNDCDGDVDDDATDTTTVWTDADGDGYGDDSGTSVTACAYTGATVGGDCDDATASTHPGAPEQCDAIDNDCDDTVDEDVSYVDYYLDGDGDGFGAGSLVGNDCVVPAGHAANADDCNDAEAAVSPDGVEVCDGVDNDCSGAADDDATDASTWYLDEDGDTFGADDAVTACDASGDYSASVGGDCDDTETDVFPGGTEADDGVDNDCDALVDEDFAAVGDLVIAEVARQTWMGGASTDTDGQWFEVVNVSTRDVVLSGWTLQRSSSIATDMFVVDPAESVIVGAGERVVFCASDVFTLDNDADSLLECDYVWGDASHPDTYEGTYKDNTFHLQRDDDTLSLWLGSTSIDSVTWDATWPQGATKAMALDSASLNATDNDLAAAWALDSTELWWDGSTPEYGTPGY